MNTKVQEPSLEERKLQLENDKMELEIKKLDVEREKARWAALSAIVPMLVAFGTIIYGIWSLRATAINQFESKAAELALAAPSPDQAKNRTKFLVLLYRDLLPKDFVTRLESFDPNNWGSMGNDEPTIAAKKLVFQAIVSNPTHREEIVNTWKALSPEDTWIDRLSTSK